MARDIVISGIDTYKSEDNTSSSITFDVLSSTGNVVDTAEWVTGDGDTMTLGTIIIATGTKRYADGTYMLRITGTSQGITKIREINGLVIDAIDPYIGILTFDLDANDQNALKVTFVVSDLNLKTATADIRLDGSSVIIKTVDIKDQTEVVFNELESGKTYEITIKAEDNAGNTNTWSGKRALDALSPTVEIVQIYNMTHRRFTGEIKYGNKNGGNLTLSYGYYNTTDTVNPIATYAPPVLTPAAYASNQFWAFVFSDDGLLPDTEYVLKVTAKNVDNKSTTASSTFRVGKLSEIVTTPNASLLSQTKFTTDYEFKHVIGDGRLFTARLIDVASDTLVDTRVMDHNEDVGTLSFTNLVADTDYRIEYSASGQLYPNFSVGNQTFKTMPPVTLEYTPVTELSSHKQFVTNYEFENMAGSDHTFTAELFEVTEDGIVPAEFKVLGGNSGTITFVNLEPGKSYIIEYQATGPLYDGAQTFSDQTFTTLFVPTIEMEGVNGLLTKDSNTFTYKFQNITGTNTFSADLKLATNNSIVQTVSLERTGSVKFSNLLANTGYVVVFKLSGPLYDPPMTFDRSFTTLSDTGNYVDWWNPASGNVTYSTIGGMLAITFLNTSAFTGLSASAPVGVFRLEEPSSEYIPVWDSSQSWYGSWIITSNPTAFSDDTRRKAIQAVEAGTGTVFNGPKNW